MKNRSYEFEREKRGNALEGLEGGKTKLYTYILI